MKISGYTKIYNGNKQLYPWKESIKSLLGFCDEVVVVDSGSTDGTFEELKKMADEDDRIVVFQYKIDLNTVDFAYQGDGLQKARARKECTGDILIQFDQDEIFHERDYDKMKSFCQSLYNQNQKFNNKLFDCVFLYPMIEFWGKNKIRVDIPCWKPRISFNNPKITHGIPAHCRHERPDGTIYSSSSDGCDYIDSETFQLVTATSFIPADQLTFVENARLHNKKLYENSLLRLVDDYGTVYHYSWYNIKRKISTYQNYWTKHWNSMFDGDLEDTAENNMFFDKPWSKCSQKEISKLAERLEKEKGGWIFHKKVDFDVPSDWIEWKTFNDIGIKHPKLMGMKT